MKNYSIIFIIVILFLSSCKNRTTSKKDVLQGEIKIDGSSTVYPITEAITEEFLKLHPSVKITVGISGTGGGFKKFSRGEIDITNASRNIKESEIKSCDENNIKYIDLKIAYDGLVVVVNPANNWVDHLTVEELKKIWQPESQGKLTRWKQIRNNWPNEEFHLFGPGVASGTYDYFTEVIVGKQGSSRGDFTASEDDNVLVQGVANDINSLGFFGLAYYEENKDKLKLVPIDNGNGPVLPDINSVRNGSYSPLSRPLFIYINDNALTRKEVVEFIRFYLDNAENLATEVGYIPLSKEEYQKEKQKFEDFLKQINVQ